jgi:hypothetical protein
MSERCRSCGGRASLDDLVECPACDMLMHPLCGSSCDLCSERVCDDCIVAHPSADEGVCRTCAGTESWERSGYLTEV